jgi:ABC-type sugar transport system, periplasmic component
MKSRAFYAKSTTAGALAALMLALTACSGGGGSSTNSPSQAPEQTGQTAEGSKQQGGKFNLWLGWTTTVNNDSMVQKYWRENEPFVDVQVESTQGDAATALNLKLNTGGFEDAALFGRSDVINTSMIRSGTIQPLEQYFDMPDKYPGLASIPKQYLDAMKDKDGHIWSIPTWFDQNPEDPWPGWASLGWFVREDVLEKAGMKQEDLATIEGVEQYLKAASQQTDASGNKLIPLGFLSDANDENVILNTFGVSTSGGGVVPVEKKGDDYEFIYDNPQYKEAYKWMNKMYNEGLIDKEAITDKKERYKEKNQSGRMAMNVGGFFNMDAHLWEVLNGPTAPAWYYQTVPYPKVAGVDKVGINTIINPNPGDDVYISKNTKNLDAILKFFDYALSPKAEMQQEINEGPAGTFWDWVDKPLGKWHYIDENYTALHDSGDAAKKASTTPELYAASSYSNEWYPWWNYEATDSVAGRQKTIDFTNAISKMGAIRVAESYDLVKSEPGSLWEKYAPELENVRKEYKAKLMMAKDDKAFEAAWTEFQSALEKRAHWSELKDEWHQLLSKQYPGA